MMCIVCIEMSINKFGVSLEKSGVARMDYYKLNGVLRNYMRDNALCVVGADFDAKSRKIRRVAQPVADTHAVNKLNVQNSVQNISQALNSIPQPDNEIRKVKESITAFALEQQLVQNFLEPTGST